MLTLVREHGDDGSVDPAACGFARPLRSGLQEDCVLRGGSGGKMVSSDLQVQTADII